MKNVRRILLLLLMLGFSLGVIVLPAKASENTEEAAVTELNQVMTVRIDCEAKELPNRGAQSVMDYQAGSPVWVIGETQDGWYLVSYQDKKGYIPKEYIAELQVEVEERGTVGLAEAGLDEEMTAVEAENKMIVEEVERQRSESKRSYIWMIVIIILVIGIFATGIISAMKSGRGKNHETDHSDPLL